MSAFLPFCQTAEAIGATQSRLEKAQHYWAITCAI